MGMNLAQKIIASHLVGGSMVPGEEAALRIDQTLTQDATGTMAYLEFESMGIPRVKTKKSVAYIDHNTLQSGFENADDHRYIQSVAKKHGVWFSRPGNGICHQVHLERFGVPGMTLIGSDSHTPTAGGLGMLAFGAGGMDVAVAMGGGAYYITMPRVIKVEVTGRLRPFVTAKDVSLELLRILSVKGGVGHVIEWGGEGIASLSVPERATITNMGTELGATSSIFPSDEVTRAFLRAQQREADYTPLAPDPDAEYDRVIHIDLSALEPLIACPHMPDKVVPVSSLKGTKVDQVCIGSCTNSSLFDMLKAAALLKGRTIAPSVSMSVSPGSRQVLTMLSGSEALTDILASGARLLECACGPCIGMGFSPNSGGVSLRTFNRNFEGRSGTKSAQVYLVSPETAAASALAGKVADPRKEPVAAVPAPKAFPVDDSMFLYRATARRGVKKTEIVRGPNIAPVPKGAPMPETYRGVCAIKVGDKITTDHIMPAGARLKFRSNVPQYAKFVFEPCDPAFHDRCLANKEKGLANVIVAGESYGQGSSREHAALCPMYLGVKAVIAKSIERIHRANLINFGIVPFTFDDPKAYDTLAPGDALELVDVKAAVSGDGRVTVKTAKGAFTATARLSGREKQLLLAGGLLASLK